MTIKERAEKGAQLKATGACNCTQAVVKAFQDKLNVDEESLMKIASGFAAGMGCMEGTCGALVGAIMVAGILSQGQRTPPISKNLLTKFKEVSGATICKELKTPVNGKVLCECPQCVANA
ncbi:MAG: C-GCAxxG-C-C family protein, partial [Treponema sp.]|nr:C-GCAxxG-C-C family protein [Treponema sp.]